MAATVETVKEERPAIALSFKHKVLQEVLKNTGELNICIMERKKKSLKYICLSFRDLDPADHHPWCHGSLCNRLGHAVADPCGSCG